MNPDRAIGIILAASLGVVLLLGIWLLRRAHSESAAPPSTPTATAPPTAVPATSTPATAVESSARGYRLAGTVVGDLAYAIIEDPNGVNQLYRIGQTVPGLGELTAIEADRITLVGNANTFALQLAPAPTTTPPPPRTEPARSQSSPAAMPARRPRRVPSESESSP